MLGLEVTACGSTSSGDQGFVGVTLVGGGPGDSELLTVAGLKALMFADVVVADHLAPRDVLADLPASVELVDVSKHPRSRFTAQQEINGLLIDRARAGKRVVRFKGGDLYVFGRGYEELLACRDAGVPVRVVPGLSSSIAVPALAGIPVTHRGVVHGFTVVSGHVPPGHPESLTNWSALAHVGGTLVLLMAVANVGAIADALIDAGRPEATPVAIICDGSLPTERTVLSTLSTVGDDVAQAQVSPPAVIVIGEVVGLRG